MHLFYHVALVITLTSILNDGLGSRGSRSIARGARSVGGSFGSGGSSGGDSSSGDNNNTGKIIVPSVIGGISGLVTVIFGSLFCYRRYKGKPSRSSPVIIVEAVPNTHTYEKDPFDDGIWFAQYIQHGVWHGPHQCSLKFNRKTNQIIGRGTDDVGRFTIDGTFSVEAHRMVFTKAYQLGTGNPAENFGHTVTVQLTWNPSTLQFEGKWYVHNKKHQDIGAFQLKLKRRETTELEGM